VSGLRVAVSSGGLIHGLLVAEDAAIGLFGARIPFITISTRTALAILRAQEAGTAAAPWARWLGALLELLDPGHLQAAMQADYDRATLVLYLIRGAQ